MKSSSRTDEDLIKRARYGGRNVTGLAILASIPALMLLPWQFVAPDAGLLWAAITFALIAAAYWMLATVTRQGETLGLSIILCLMAIQLLLSLAGVLLAYARNNKTAGMELWIVIIPLLIVVALAGNRSDLVELHRRGLGESVFGPGRPPRMLTILGGVMLVGAQIAFFAALIIPGFNAARSKRETQEFVTMMNVNDKALMQIINDPNRRRDKQFWVLASEAADRLREQAKQVDAKVPEGSKMKSITSTYLRGIDRWCTALSAAREQGQLSPQSAAAVDEGDELRARALDEFQREFPALAPRQK